MIIKDPVLTEKSTDMLDENKMTFMVDVDSNKNQIAEEVEEVYEMEVDGVNTMINSRGRKKAVVKFVEEGDAESLATRLGLF